jgi:hypothetical protein
MGELPKIKKGQKGLKRSKGTGSRDVSFIPKKETCQRRECSSVTGDKTVGHLGNRREAGEALIQAKPEPPIRIHRARAKNRFRTAVNRAIRFDELNAPVEVIARDLRKLISYSRVLERDVFNRYAGGALPPFDPEPAKIALAVKDHQRFGRR